MVVAYPRSSPSSSPVSYSKCFNCLSAGGELNPSTDSAQGCPVVEEKESEANDAGNDEHHGEADEERGVFESS